MEVENSTVVTLRYTMKNNDGEILEDTMEGPPLQYLHGSGNIIPELEACLSGLKDGDERAIFFTMSNGSDEKFHFNVIIDNVRPATGKELIEGKPTQNCGPDCCC